MWSRHTPFAIDGRPQWAAPEPHRAPIRKQRPGSEPNAVMRSPGSKMGSRIRRWNRV